MNHYSDAAKADEAWIVLKIRKGLWITIKKNIKQWEHDHCLDLERETERERSDAVRKAFKAEDIDWLLNECSTYYLLSYYNSIYVPRFLQYMYTKKKENQNPKPWWRQNWSLKADIGTGEAINTEYDS